ncbi:MAG: hypothetical protein R6V14_08065 [Halanaerobiales bacterium]
MSNEAFKDDLFDATVAQLSDLYIINRTRYLKLNIYGKYETEIFKKNTDIYNDDSVPLQDFHLKAHLRKKYTIGVFANPRYDITKFICFDVDVENNELAKKVVTKIIKTLNDLGITNEYIYVSWSGNRGYHVEIFFVRWIKNYIAEKLFNIVIYNAGLMDIDYGKVEFLPTSTRGVKLPLGVNFKGENAFHKLCLYVDYENGFNYIKDKEFVLKIIKIDRRLIEYIIDCNNTAYEMYRLTTSLNTILINQSANSNIASPSIANNHIPSIDYMTASVDVLLKLEAEGLKETRSRNNATVGLAKLFKCHYGFDREECIKRLIEWMNWQDKKYYKTPLHECIKEIKGVVACAFNNNYQLSGSVNKIEISKKEIEEILKVKPKSGKLIFFAILLHSKIHYKKNGKFYMSFLQMANYTGLSKNTCITHTNKLVENKFIKAVSRNVYYPDGKWKKANYYKVLIDKEQDDPVLCFSFSSIDDKRTKKAFLECLSLIDEKVIKRSLNKKDFSYYKNKKYYVL